MRKLALANRERGAYREQHGVNVEREFNAVIVPGAASPFIIRRHFGAGDKIKVQVDSRGTDFHIPPRGYHLSAG